MVAAPPTAAPLLRTDSRLSFPSLTVVEEGAEYMVGEPKSGVFIAIPEMGLLALRELQAGATVAEASATTSSHAGQYVDVLDFATGLAASGLVAAVDGMPLSDAPGRRERSWLEVVRPGMVRPFFSPLAWAIYGLIFTLCAVVFVTQPAYWPSFEDFFFYPDPAICIVVLTVVRIFLVAGHEMCHWLAARAVGVGARFSISRRLYFPVFETDVSQLLSVPRRQRFSPFLAGMAFDTVVLAACLALRLAAASSLIEAPPLLTGFAAAVILLQVFGLGWQMLVYLRTDLYAVLVTALNCRNLYRINHLYLRSKLRKLDGMEVAELAQAHPRDLQVARWFSVFYAVGLLWAGWLFVNYFLPSTVLLTGWMFYTLTGAPPASLRFWEALIVGGVAAFNVVTPLVVLGCERLQMRRQTA